MIVPLARSPPWSGTPLHNVGRRAPYEFSDKVEGRPLSPSPVPPASLSSEPTRGYLYSLDLFEQSELLLSRSKETSRWWTINYIHCRIFPDGSGQHVRPVTCFHRSTPSLGRRHSTSSSVRGVKVFIYVCIYFY